MKKFILLLSCYLSISVGAITAQTYTITATSGNNGSISPIGSVTVSQGGSRTFIFTPAAGFVINQVLVDGSNNSAAVSSGSYTFTSVTVNHTISVTFRLQTLPTFSGSGTQASPFLISSKADMMALANAVEYGGSNGTTYSGMYFLLTANLTGSNALATSVGSYSSGAFSGIFDGGNHEIELNNSPNGVFGYLVGATVQNLGIKGTVSASSSSSSYVGGICGRASNATIVYCYNSATITSTSSSASYAGGICGYASSSSISNCYNLGAITSSSSSSSSSYASYAGGICGYASSSSISNCYNLGAITSSSSSSSHASYAGGICGYASNATIVYCYNSATITSTSSSASHAGGICGYASSSSISNCYNLGAITSSSSSSSYASYAGGICGSASSSSSSISNCYNSATITSTSSSYSYAGGICGYASSSPISNCYNLGNISSSSSSYNPYAGGICGSGVANNCFAANSIITAKRNGTNYSNYAGRIGGSVTVSNCYASLSMTINGSAVSSTDGNSKNGNGVAFSSFQSQAWIVSNLVWDFNTVWKMSNTTSMSKLPILKNLPPAPIALTITGTIIADKMYDGNVSAIVANWGTLNGVILGDNVIIDPTNVTISFNNKNVENNKSVTLSNLQLAGTAAENYVIKQPVGLTANITPKTLTLTGTTIANKEYDGNTSASVSNWGTLNGAIPGDNININTTGITAFFNNKNIENDKPVTLSNNISFMGTDADNYLLSQQPSGLTANITPKMLTLTGTTITNKEYDGNIAAIVGSWGTLNGIVSGENVNLNTTNIMASFNDKNIGNNKPVTLSGITLSGTDASKYEIIQPTGLSANITPQSLTLTGTTIANKEYDGNTSASVSNWGTLNGVITGDNININTAGITASFNNKNAENNKPVILSNNISFVGTDAGNYLLSQQPNGLSANIIHKNLILIGITIADKEYDGNTSATVSNWGTLEGIITGENVNFNTAGITASFNDGNAGYNKPIILNGTITLNGTDVGNYILIQPSGLTGNITSSIAELTGLSINGEAIDISIGNGFRYVLPCGTSNVSISANGMHNGSVFINGNAIPYIFTPSLGSQELNITVTASDNSQTANYTLTLVKPLENAVLQVWDDVLSVINIPANNGGYTFTAYQWQENGIDLPGETGGNLYLANRPNASAAAYTVTLTTADGQTLQTCPVTLGAPSLRAYPNPVSDKITLESSVITSGDEVKIYNNTGNQVHTVFAVGSRTEMDLSALLPGIYILQVKNERIRIIKK